MEVKVITNLAAEPVTLAEIKQFLQMDVDFTADDTMLTALNTSAREYLEKLTGLSFGEKTLKLTKQVTGRGLIEVLYGPVSEITSVVDGDGATIDHDVYGTEFPSIDTGSLCGQVEVNYIAGFTSLPGRVQI